MTEKDDPLGLEMDLDMELDGDQQDQELDRSQFPEGSLCRDMIIDIYVNKGTGEVFVLVDRPFDEGRPRHILFNASNNELYMMMPDETLKPYGETLKPIIADKVSKAKQAFLFEVNRKNNRIVGGYVLPVIQM